MDLDNGMLEPLRAATEASVCGVVTDSVVAVAVQHDGGLNVQAFSAEGESMWVARYEGESREIDYSDVDDFLAALAEEDQVRLCSSFEDNLVLHGRGLLPLGPQRPTLDDVWLPAGAEDVDFPFRTADESCGRKPQYVARVGGELWAAVDAAGPGVAARLVRLCDQQDRWPLIDAADEAVLGSTRRTNYSIVWAGQLGERMVCAVSTLLRSGSHDHVLSVLDDSGVHAAIELRNSPARHPLFVVGSMIVAKVGRELAAMDSKLGPTSPPAGRGRLIGGSAAGSVWLDLRRRKLYVVR